MFLFRILISFFFVSSFAIGNEGEVKLIEINIILTEKLSIRSESTISFNELTVNPNLYYPPLDLYSTGIIKLVYEF